MKRGGERILESRHLVGLFLGVVLLCAVFFSLGYVMGKTQYGYGPVHAEGGGREFPSSHPTAKTVPPPPPIPPNSEWDFYSKNPNNGLEAAPKSSSAAPSRPSSSPPAARSESPRLIRGSIVVQVAAVTHQSDALAVADALQRKQFASFVVAPTTDNFYRVQVGPFQDEKSAEDAVKALDRAGFKAIIKR
jgi:DedD protein